MLKEFDNKKISYNQKGNYFRTLQKTAFLPSVYFENVKLEQGVNTIYFLLIKA